MSGPLPALLAEALELVHDENPDPGDPPVMADLYAAARKVLAMKGYSAELESDLSAALEVRLGMLTRLSAGRIFQCGESAPCIEQLMASYSVCELAHLPPESACLTTLFILNAIHAHVRTTPYSNGKMRFAIVIEEAHNLVGCDRDAVPSESNADPKAFAAELICNMLAELRALGVAIVIVDQSPSKVARAVIKATATKLALPPGGRGGSQSAWRHHALRADRNGGNRPAGSRRSLPLHRRLSRPTTHPNRQPGRQAGLGGTAAERVDSTAHSA